MKTVISGFITMALILSACSSLSDTARTGNQAADFEQLATQIENGNYQFVVRTASPSGGRTIQITSFYALKAENGTYEARLPYFGRAYSGGYGSGGSIEFKGEPENLQITRKDNKDQITISFSIRSDTERYDVTLDVGRSAYGNLAISSSKRQTISYYGIASALED